MLTAAGAPIGEGQNSYTAAKGFSQVGQKTDLIVHFSMVAGELGTADAERQARGFALKPWTEGRRPGFVGNNTPFLSVILTSSRNSFTPRSVFRGPICVLRLRCGISGRERRAVGRGKSRPGGLDRRSRRFANKGRMLWPQATKSSLLAP
jgi:hypothetical protein